MRRNALKILLGLVLAVAGAAVVSQSAEWLRSAAPGDDALMHSLWRRLLAVAALGLPFALVLIWLAEARRVRGITFWLGAGALVAGLSYVIAHGSHVGRSQTLVSILASGLAGGWVYWAVAGRHSGAFLAAIDRENQAAELSGAAPSRRCWACGFTMIMIGLLPLALGGWLLAEHSGGQWPNTLRQQAQAEGNRLLLAAGVPSATLKIDDHIGRVTGTAATPEMQKEAFAKADAALRPLVGAPGIVAYLQNDIVSEDMAASNAKAEDDVRRLHADFEALEQRRLAEAADQKRIEAEAAAAKARAEQARRDAERKVEEERTLAREAEEKKRKADEEAAKARAEQERLAAERRAEEKRRQEREAAEQKRIELEAAAAKAWEDAQRLAAERKAEDERRLARDAEEQKRKGEEEAELQRRVDAEKRKADDERRLSLEAEREREAVAAARKADAEKSEGDATDKDASNAHQTTPALPAPTNCDAEFAQLFKSTTVQFASDATTLDPNLQAFLDSTASLAKQCVDYAIEISGHADRTGSEAVNLATSLARAAAAREALLARGVPLARLHVTGYGDSRPLDPSRNRAAYARNRRVELSAVRKLASPPPAPSLSAGPTAKFLSTEACHVRLSRVVAKARIRFAVNSARIRPAAARAIGAIARVARRCSNHALTINGHADRRGSIEDNRALSERRAESVRDLLTKQGAAADRLSIVGHGALLPLIDSQTRSAFAKNRRVDFDVSVSADQ